MDENDTASAEVVHLERLHAMLTWPNPYLPEIIDGRTGLGVDQGWREIGYLKRGAGVPLTSSRDSYRMPKHPIIAEVAELEIDADTARMLLGIPPGFPMWYRPERLALPAGRSS